MTPIDYLKLARDIAVVGGLLLILWMVRQSGSDHAKAADLKTLQKQVAAQGKILDTWHKEAIDANTKLQSTLAAINAAPAVVHDWVRPQSSCPKSVLSTPSVQTGPSRTDASGVQPEHGGAVGPDRRDSAVAEFKRRWGTELATCQSFLDQWPQ